VTTYYLIVTVRSASTARHESTMGEQGPHVDRGIEMAARVRKDRLEVQNSSAPEVVHHDVPESPADSTVLPYVEPEEYGLRVNWQSEAVRIEAAEFLVATRVQESSRRRLARAMARMRDQVRTEPNA
jgi:hypothetical protein